MFYCSNFQENIKYGVEDIVGADDLPLCDLGAVLKNGEYFNWAALF